MVAPVGGAAAAVQSSDRRKFGLCQSDMLFVPERVGVYLETEWFNRPSLRTVQLETRCARERYCRQRQ